MLRFKNILIEIFKQYQTRTRLKTYKLKFFTISRMGCHSRQSYTIPLLLVRSRTIQNKKTNAATEALSFNYQ